MSLGREQVLHVAKLAEMEVPAAEVEALVAQISRIVDYVAQLDEVPTGEAAAPFLAGPAATPLRADIPGSVPLAHGPEAFAPEFRDGFFLVPRLGAMEAE